MRSTHQHLAARLVRAAAPSTCRWESEIAYGLRKISGRTRGYRKLDWCRTHGAVIFRGRSLNDNCCRERQAAAPCLASGPGNSVVSACSAGAVSKREGTPSPFRAPLDCNLRASSPDTPMTAVQHWDNIVH